MPFWRKSKKFNLPQISGDGNLQGVLPSLDEPSIKLKKHQVIKDEAAVQSTNNFSLLSPLRSNEIRERSHGSSAVLSAEELDKHFPDRRLKLYIATWNMEGKKFPNNVEDLLFPSDDDYGKDVYVIGIQEGYPNRQEWELKLQQTLGPHYVMHHSSGHGVLYLTIFIRRELIWFCSEVESAHVTTRRFHYVKTKGALGVAFTIFGTSFLFITTHLRSAEKRVVDYKVITEGLRLPRKLPARTDSSEYKLSTFDVTTRFDRVFWFGDLNYQLKEDRKTVESLLRTIEGRDMSSLVELDSLNEAKSNGSIFKGFHEDTIRFHPTYKFDVGTDNYDTSAKQRIPSYTDRVLYKCQHAGDVQAIRYDACPIIKTSDHKPVYGVFAVKLRPGTDDIPLAGGQFAHKVYSAAIRNRNVPPITVSCKICLLPKPTSMRTSAWKLMRIELFFIKETGMSHQSQEDPLSSTTQYETNFHQSGSLEVDDIKASIPTRTKFC
ncbi:phosphatidylinositol polyphosphate 5-phosphatase type IV-like [Eleutherodactylus coqui]|uniref:phosphatidylinositol polyphosphate 5-phosphatase type IV-like n=1 Tax=Eleutherodactylus coqui TaxID=57060 RepID=UPI0034634EEB